MDYFYYIGTFALLIVGLALYLKGEVKAGLKLYGLELSIETKEPSKKRQKTPRQLPPSQ